MKLFLTLALLSGALYAQTEPGTTNEAGLGDVAPTTTTRGLDIDGTGDMAPQPYPNSGQTRARSNDIAGEDLSPAEQTSSVMQQDATGAPAGGAGKQDTTLDMKDGFVDQVADIPTDQVFEAALSQGKTQTGPYDVMGEEQAMQAEVEREAPVETDTQQEKTLKQQGE